MKYTEFKERIEDELKAEVDIDKYDCTVNKEFCGRRGVAARVSNETRFAMMMGHNCFDLDIFNDFQKQQLLELCYKLASTPLEEREEEKKYRLKFSGFSNIPHAYISKGKLTNTHQIKMLGFCDFQYEFTEKEIEAFPNKVWEHAHKCDWEVVE